MTEAQATDLIALVSTLLDVVRVAAFFVVASFGYAAARSLFASVRLEDR